MIARRALLAAFAALPKKASHNAGPVSHRADSIPGCASLSQIRGSLRRLEGLLQAARICQDERLLVGDLVVRSGRVRLRAAIRSMPALSPFNNAMSYLVIQEDRGLQFASEAL